MRKEDNSTLLTYQSIKFNETKRLVSLSQKYHTFSATGPGQKWSLNPYMYEPTKKSEKFLYFSIKHS